MGKKKNKFYLDMETGGFNPPFPFFISEGKSNIVGRIAQSAKDNGYQVVMFDSNKAEEISKSGRINIIDLLKVMNDEEK